MNTSALVRHMRAGGWDEHARRLADGIIKNGGLPLLITKRGRTVRVRYDRDDGQLVAEHISGEGAKTIATEQGVAVAMLEVAPAARSRQVMTTMRLPAEALELLDRRAEKLGTNRATLIRQAVYDYLDWSP